MRQRQRPEQQQHHNDLLDTAPTDESAAVRRRRREDEEARAATLAQLRLGGPRIEVTLQGLFVAVGLLVVGYVVTMVFPWLSPSSLLALWRRGLYALDDWITGE